MPGAQLIVSHCNQQVFARTSAWMAASVYRRTSASAPRVTTACVASTVSSKRLNSYRGETLNLCPPISLTAKCVIPCKNEGRCIGNNLCRCPNGLRGDHCEIGRKQRSICKCRNGTCVSHKHCKCHPGFYGRHCNGRKCSVDPGMSGDQDGLIKIC